MKEELEAFLVSNHEEHNSKNSFYHRQLDTQYGAVEDLKVPRDRKGQFQTALFKPHQRRVGWLEESIIRMYQAGMSTREVGQFVERILGHHYSPQTISRITDSVLDDIQQWQQRPLRKRYSVIYLDALFRKIRRQKVATEAIYLALGVNEEGNREILGFYVGGSEAAYGWLEVLQALKERGVEEVLLGVFDGLPSLDESFQQVFPKADVQRCVVHKVRNTLRKIRKKDQPEFA